MSPSEPVRARGRLQPHGSAAHVDALNVELEHDGDALVVRYAIVGALDRLRIPAFGTALDPERLWAHTCCELFLAPAAGAGYVEWNFSPSGQLARFAFTSYRERAASAPPAAGAPRVTVHGRALELEARVPVARLDLRISITAVVEDADGALSYWALHHPRDRPDFHDPGGFAWMLTLGPPLAIVQR